MASPQLSREEAAQLLGERLPAKSGRAPAGGVERVSWEEFHDYLEDQWEAGEGASIFAPTKGGKTHLIRHGLLPLWQRYPVLWLRFKPRDKTLAGFGQEVRAYPERMARLKYELRPADSPKWASDPEWFVIVLPKYHWSPDGKRASEAWHQARVISGTALDRAFHDGGWVIVIDEVQAFADQDEPGLALKAPLANLWQRGRDQPVTMIAGTQAPANAPSQMYDQVRWVYFGRTLDVGRYQRISEIGGDTEAIKATLPSLDFQEFLAIDRHSGEMWVVKAPAGRGR